MQTVTEMKARGATVTDGNFSRLVLIPVYGYEQVDVSGTNAFGRCVSVNFREGQKWSNLTMNLREAKDLITALQLCISKAEM